jgi:hypothetical protein
MRIRRLIYHILWLGALYGGRSPELQGQSPFDPAFRSEAIKISEHLNLFTDRSIYAVGESLQFRADQTVSAVEAQEWSSVLYLELVTASGNAVAQGKFILKDGMSKGSLQIPSGTLTGLYYLKCYTRWMRNSGPGTFSFTPLKIINPNRMEVANGTYGKGYESNVTRIAYKQGEIKCSSDASLYGRDEEVTLQLSGPLNTYMDQLNCCITVVPLGGIDTLSGQLFLPSEKAETKEFSIDYLPDMGEGPSLSGSVVLSDQTAAQFTTLHFTLLGENPDFFATLTDANGRFALSSPRRFGVQEFYVSPNSLADELLEVRIDQDFDVAPIPVPAIKFGLTEWERNIATRIALNMQLARVYGTPVPHTDESPKRESPPFYGSRVQKMYMDDYVNLPTLEEVFINLIPNVNVLKRKGVVSLSIESINRTIGIFEPLIMIDNISVFDQKAILALPPEKIHRIDLINEIYLKGNVAFGGLISIYSKSGDMAGIDLPPGSYFFDFQSFNREDAGFAVSPAPGDRIPDMRNTVFWKNDVIIGKERVNELTFKAPSNPGQYVILVRGVAPNGEVLSATSRFKVE